MTEEEARMGDYEDVDREIHDFLAQKRPGAQKAQTSGGRPGTDILPLLESLSKTYGEINTYLRTENGEALKDVILKSDVKMSLVCETLLETLRKTTEEKKELLAENAGLCRVRRELEEKEALGRIQRGRLEQELECKKTNISELNRIIKDQKDRIAEYREESLRMKSDFMVNKTRVDELENLRSKAAERLAVYEKEIEAIKGVISEKDEAIGDLVREKRKEEEKNSAVKTKICECERMVEILGKKLESKENNLSLCNNELSKVLAENKMMKGEFDRYKEGFAYYEGLYNTLNKQNGYLNSQLNKMLRSGDYNKDSAAFVRKYKLRSRRSKKMLRQKEEENAALRSKLETVREEVRESRVSDTESSEPLIKRIEELTEANKELKRRMEELEAEKRMAERRALEKGDRPVFKGGDRKGDPERIYRDTERFHKPSYHHDLSAGNPCSFAQPVRKDYLSDYGMLRPSSHHFDRESKSFNEIFSSPNFINPMMAELKKEPEEYKGYAKPNLENDYEEKEMGNLLGGFEDGLKTEGALADGKDREQVRHNEGATAKISAGPGLFSQLLPSNAGAGFTNEASKAEKAGHGKQQSSIGSAPVDNPFVEENSAESVKTYHTTSTLKDMIARTDKLQKKFESLEDQLANIKEGDTEERLVDKIRAYNTHCSELNIDSDDSDFL